MRLQWHRKGDGEFWQYQLPTQVVWCPPPARQHFPTGCTCRQPMWPLRAHVLRLCVVAPLALHVYFHIFILSCKSVRVFRGAGYTALTCEHQPALLTEAEKRISGWFEEKEKTDMLDINNRRTPPTTHAPVLLRDVIKTIMWAKRHSRQ